MIFFNPHSQEVFYTFNLHGGHVKDSSPQQKKFDEPSIPRIDCLKPPF